MHIYELAAEIKVNIFFVMISQNFNLTNCQSYFKSYFGTDDQASGTGGLQMWVVSWVNNIIYLLYLHEVCHHTNNSNHMLSKYMIFASFFLFWARLHRVNKHKLSIGPQYNKTGSHTPQIYFWLFPENIYNQQDMLHIFIYTEGAQFPLTTIICSKKSTIDSLKNFDYWAL